MHLHERAKIEKLPWQLADWHKDASMELTKAETAVRNLQQELSQHMHDPEHLPPSMRTTAALDAKARLEGIAPVGHPLVSCKSQ